MNIKENYLLSLIVALILLGSCGPNSGLLDEANTYDQELFLANMADSLIAPSVVRFSESVDALNLVIDAYENEPEAANLPALRTALLQARKDWQWVQPFTIGPMATYGLAAATSIYPIDIQEVERNIIEGDYNFGAASNLDAAGFQALGYLLYGEPGTADEVIISELAVAERWAYLKAVTAYITDTNVKVMEALPTYLTSFKSAGSFGVDAGSSTATLVNALNQNLERNLRDGKLGIPVGLRSANVAIPAAAEAYYADYSLELLMEAVRTYEYIFEGKGLDGTDGEGFYEYLKAIKAQDTGEEDLADLIRDQLASIQAKLAALDGELTQLIENDPNRLIAIFADLQRLSVHFKTDMASAMGVVIVYQDNDGD